MKDELFDAIYGVKIEAEEFFAELTPKFASELTESLEARGWLTSGDSIEKDIEALSRFFSPGGPYNPALNGDIDVFYRDSDMTFFVGLRIQNLLAQDGSVSNAKDEVKKALKGMLRHPSFPDLIIFEYWQ